MLLPGVICELVQKAQRGVVNSPKAQRTRTLQCEYTIRGTLSTALSFCPSERNTRETMSGCSLSCFSLCDKEQAERGVWEQVSSLRGRMVTVPRAVVSEGITDSGNLHSWSNTSTPAGGGWRPRNVLLYKDCLSSKSHSRQGLGTQHHHLCVCSLTWMHMQVRRSPRFLPLSH